MPKGRREVVDIVTPVPTAEGEEDQESVQGNHRKDYPGYNLRRGPRREEPVRPEVAGMYLEDAPDLGVDEEEEYREPDRRMPRERSRSIRLEPYDGSSSWPEYLVYFEQMAEFQGWNPREAAMTLGLSLRGAARTVLVSLTPEQRRDLRQLTGALRQNFCPPEQVHLYQAELKSRKKKRDETMADLGRDLARLVQLAYPQADMATRETLAINAFLDALPGPAIEIRLHVIKGRPKTLQEAVAYATEIDAVLQTTGTRAGYGGRIRKIEEEGPPAGVSKDLRDLAEAVRRLERKVNGKTAGGAERRPMVKKRLAEIKCYGCGKMGHMRRECPTAGEGERVARPGNGGARLIPPQ